MAAGATEVHLWAQHVPLESELTFLILRCCCSQSSIPVTDLTICGKWQVLSDGYGQVLKRGRSGVCALWSVTEPSRRRRKVSKWLHEDDGLDTGGELPINALPQRTNETQTNNLRATRSIPQLTARPTIMPLPGSIFMQLTTCLLLGSASTPPQYYRTGIPITTPFQYCDRLLAYSVHYTLDSIKEFHFTFHNKRIATGVTNPMGWAQIDQYLVDLHLRKRHIIDP